MSLEIKELLLFISIFIFIFIAKVIATYLGLVDKPNYRKKHIGNIPLIGGISIYFGLWLLPFFFVTSQSYLNFMACNTILIVVGVLDDRFDIPVKPRLITQFIVGCIMISSGFYFNELGNLFGFGSVYIGYFGILVTLIAVSASINMFNMIDGIDGLLGVLSIVSFSSFCLVFYLKKEYLAAMWILGIILILIPYLLLNLGLFGKKQKVFMGDAGSTLIGFIMVWLLIRATQGEQAVITPASSLWLIGVPFIDMISIMLRRIHSKHSPFKPDRKHLHHVLTRAGFTSRQTLLIMASISILMSAIGILGNQFNIPEWILFYGFILVLACYLLFFKSLWRFLCRFVKVD